MRLVFDTNVLFAALVARRGLCAKVVETAFAEHEVFCSQFILDELARILEQKAKVEKLRIATVIESLLAGAEAVNPAYVSADAVRDPKDSAILGTALASRADALVSGDTDLLTLGRFESIPIISPRQFHDQFIAAKS